MHASHLFRILLLMKCIVYTIQSVAMLAQLPNVINNNKSNIHTWFFFSCMAGAELLLPRIHTLHILTSGTHTAITHIPTEQITHTHAHVHGFDFFFLYVQMVIRSIHFEHGRLSKKKLIIIKKYSRRWSVWLCVFQYITHFFLFLSSFMIIFLNQTGGPRIVFDRTLL